MPVAGLCLSLLSGLLTSGSSSLPPPSPSEAPSFGPMDRLTPVVNTAQGPIRGVVRWDTDYSVESFFSIPYAKPPLGDYRFLPPEPLDASDFHDSIFDALGLPRMCVQMGLDEANMHLGEEDCLHLHVFRPAGTTETDRLPVMVWVFGGAFIIGDPWFLGMYDPTRIVEQHKVVFVSINYRLNLFGFLALDELRKEAGTAGNMALQDQQEALRWVKTNIAGFGGDPQHVLLFGESAGAMSVLWHLVSPASKEEQLFSSAVMMSPTDSIFFEPWEEAEGFSRGLAKYLLRNFDCPLGLLQCLRRLPAASFAVGMSDYVRAFVASVTGQSLLHQKIPDRVSPLFPFHFCGPVIDGTTFGLRDSPLALLQSGQFADVPVLILNNLDEGSVFAKFSGVIVPSALIPGPSTVLKTLSWTFADEVDERRMFDAYRDYIDHAEFTILLGRLFRDIVFHCPSQRIAGAISQAGKAPVWLASYSQPLAHFLEKSTGNVHAMELLPLFQNPGWAGSILPDGSKARDGTVETAQYMGVIWANMARCGAPSCQQMRVSAFRGVQSRRVTSLYEEIEELSAKWGPFSDTNRQFLALRNHEVAGHSPHVKRIQEDNLYDPSDRFSDEWPNSRKCSLVNELTPKIQWKDVRDGSFLHSFDDPWWERPGNFINGSAMLAYNVFFAPTPSPSPANTTGPRTNENPEHSFAAPSRSVGWLWAVGTVLVAVCLSLSSLLSDSLTFL